MSVSLTKTVTIESMLTALASDDLVERLQAASDMVSCVDAAFGPDATEIGEHIRTLSGLPIIVEALGDSHAEFQQKMLVVLGNLSSDAFDAKSCRTKVLLRDTPVMPLLVPHLSSTSSTTTLYATACLQNMCHDRELAAKALRSGAHPLLLELVKDDQPLLKKFAAGALHNLCRAVRQMQAEGIGEDVTVMLDPDTEQAVARRIQQYSHERKLETAAALRLQAAARRLLAMREAAQRAAPSAQVGVEGAAPVVDATTVARGGRGVQRCPTVIASQLRWLEESVSPEQPRRASGEGMIKRAFSMSIKGKGKGGGGSDGPGGKDKENSIRQGGVIARTGSAVRRAMAVRPMPLQQALPEPELRQGDRLFHI